MGASADGIRAIIEGLNQRHAEESVTRQCADKVKGFLEVADGYLKVINIFIQHHPEISSLVVGGLKLFVDVCVGLDSGDATKDI